MPKTWTVGGLVLHFETLYHHVADSFKNFALSLQFKTIGLHCKLIKVISIYIIRKLLPELHHIFVDDLKKHRAQFYTELVFTISDPLPNSYHILSDKPYDFDSKSQEKNLIEEFEQILDKFYKSKAKLQQIINLILLPEKSTSTPLTEALINEDQSLSQVSQTQMVLRDKETTDEVKDTNRLDDVSSEKMVSDDEVSISHSVLEVRNQSQ